MSVVQGSLLEQNAIEFAQNAKLRCLFAGAVLFVAYLHCVAFAVWHACFVCVNVSERAGALYRCLPMRCLFPPLTH